MGLLRGAHLREQQRTRAAKPTPPVGPPAPRECVHGRGGVATVAGRGPSRASFWSRLGAGNTVHSTGAAQRLARQVLGAAKDCSGQESLLGDAAETDAHHRRRHPQLRCDCARCVYLELRPQLLNYGSYHHQGHGRRAQTIWLAQRPGRLGGVWALGCVFCSRYLQRDRHNQRGAQQPRRRGPQHGNTKWARFEIRALSQMANRGIRQHSETESHRVATRFYFNPDRFCIRWGWLAF